MSESRPSEVVEAAGVDYTEKDLDKYHKLIFKGGVILDRIAEDVDYEGSLNLQQVNKWFSAAVTDNTKFWSKRRVVITKENVHQIMTHPMKRVWVNARLLLLKEAKDYRNLQYIWRELDDLIVISTEYSQSDTKFFSLYVFRDVLAHAVNLTRLKMSVNLLTGSALDDLKNLKKVTWNKLTHFELVFDPPDQKRIIDELCQSFIGRRDRGNSDPKPFVELLSTFEWSKLDTFRLDTVQEITVCILSKNFLKNVRVLYLNNYSQVNFEKNLWNRMKDIEMPNLTFLTTSLMTEEAVVHSFVRKFLEKQPKLATINLLVRKLVSELFQVTGSTYPFKHLNLRAQSTDEAIMSDISGFLTKLHQLKSFNFEFMGCYHHSWPAEPTADEIIDILPPTVTRLRLRLCVGMNGRCPCLTQEKMMSELYRLARESMPNLVQTDIEMLVCPVCKIWTESNDGPASTEMTSKMSFACATAMKVTAKMLEEHISGDPWSWRVVDEGEAIRQEVFAFLQL